VSYRRWFQSFLRPERLHFAAHSHHLWPDVTHDAHDTAWRDAAEHADHKWDLVLGEVVPEMQRHVAGRLGLPNPATVAIAPNTHELVNRLASSLPRPLRILTTDGEFHSFRRQAERWEEEKLAYVDRVPVEPFATFADRFIDAAHDGHDLLYLSHVFYDSGFVVPALVALVEALPLDPVVVVDGYHGFMALPTDIGPVADRIFYTAGGYKYAMAGEGACFMHCPRGVVSRPLDTGWFAGFGALEGEQVGVPYAPDAGRFWGATFDPTPLYRFNAVQRLLDAEGVDVPTIHDHVMALAGRFVAGLGDEPALGELIPPWGAVADRGHFLTFRSTEAAALQDRLDAAGVVTDRRNDRLRIGFGIYHDAGDVDSLLGIVRSL
jgi:kynureninase